MSAKENGDTAPSVLIVDDDEAFRTVLARAFRARGYDARVAGGYDEAVVSARADAPEMAVVDLRMRGRSGLEVVQFLKELDPATAVVVLTGFGSIATATEAMRLGATSYLRKPADLDDVLEAFGEEVARASEQRPSDADMVKVEQALAACNGDVVETAARLKVHRRRLRRWLALRTSS